MFFANSCKLILVSTGQLAKVYPNEVSKHFIENYCNTYGAQGVKSIASNSNLSLGNNMS